MRYIVKVLATAVLLTACTSLPAPVTMRGGDADLATLAGEWEGEYRSLETGRIGSIVFRLTAGGDSAYGDVLMMAPGMAGLPESAEPGGAWHSAIPRDELLTITFVELADGVVSGLLDPYADPTCGCLLETRFRGVVEGDVIEGTFTSRHGETGKVQEGRWRVTRLRR